MVQHCFGRHGPQVELQTARQHRDRHFLGIGGGQHELEVFGRLFQGFQHGIESRVGEHVHFVNHEHLETTLHRLVNRLLQKLLHLVDAAVGGGIELGVIHKAATVDVGTGLAHATGLRRDALLAVQRFGQNARHRGLAHAPGPSEQIGMVQALLRQRIRQGLDHMLLPHHFGEVFRAVFAGKHKVRHGLDSTGSPTPCRDLVQCTVTGLPAW